MAILRDQTRADMLTFFDEGRTTDEVLAYVLDPQDPTRMEEWALLLIDGLLSIANIRVAGVLTMYYVRVYTCQPHRQGGAA